MFCSVLGVLVSWCLWKWCLRNSVLNPSSGFLWEHRALLSLSYSFVSQGVFIHEGQCWWEGGWQHTPLYCLHYIKLFEKDSAPNSQRADWSGRQLCFERSGLMKRDGNFLNPHYSPTISAACLHSPAGVSSASMSLTERNSTVSNAMRGDRWEGLPVRLVIWQVHDALTESPTVTCLWPQSLLFLPALLSHRMQDQQLDEGPGSVLELWGL